MSAKELLFKYRKLIIIILLFLVVFSIRAEAVNIGGVPDQAKSFYQDQNGLPYFSEMDSYYNLRMTQDYLDHGYLGDTIQNGTEWDLHSSFPPGQSAEYPPLIVYCTAYVYKFVNLFTHVPLNGVAIWTAPFIASLAVIPAYLLVRRLTNDYGGITAGLLVGLAPAYFAHTFAGFFDTDQFNMIIPLFVVMFFIYSMLASTMKWRTIYAALAGFGMLLFTIAWSGWYYIYYLIIGTAVIYLLISTFVLKNKTEKPTDYFKGKLGWFNDKGDLLTLIVFLIVSLILMTLSIGVGGIVTGILSPVGASQIQSAVQAADYPNVYISVSELQVPSLSEIINGVGGYLPFFFGILGVLALFWNLKTREVKEEKPKKPRKPRRRGRSSRRRVEEKEVETETKVIKPEPIPQKTNYVFYCILFSLWLLVTAYAMTQGVRFVEDFALPITLTAAIFVGLLYGFVKGRVSNISYQKIIMAIIVIAVAFSPIASAYGVSSSVVPGTDDSMVTSLQWIGNNTANNTVITSWWDFGHLFTYEANRPVTFDGSSQNSPRAYWVGKALLTSNETLSVGILRMLASSGDQAPLTLDNYTNNTGLSAQILTDILGVNKTQALTIMTTKYNLTQTQAQTIVQYTHPDNPTPDVLITSSDMVQKAGWWSYFGSWNFTSKNGTNYQYLASEMNSTTVNNKTLLIGSNAVVAQANGTNGTSAGIVDTNAITSNDTTTTLNEISNELTTGNGSLVIQPHTLTIVNNNTVTQTLVSNSSEYSILLINENGTYIGVAMNQQLENSMFTKLFFEGGAGLTHFKSLYGQPGVMVWGVTY
ncbi:MAG: STT3 domain-containing protein [Methanobacterium sp.]|uniref:STT3 domain-containing protein n=2 Tax=Methanobacterium sp. TaxID=2164 RepID=UPI003C71AC38